MKDSPPGVEELSSSALEKKLNISFTNPLLLTRALTHRSYINEHNEAVEDNERLEFLGDAILDFITASWLYTHFPEKPEGELTRIRAALVCTEQLAIFAREGSIGQAMRLGKGEDLAGGRQKDALLCATFEAIIGAIFLDKDVASVQSFFYPLLEGAIENIILEDSAHDPKSRLQEWSQGQKLGTPQYILIQASGPDHQRNFEIAVKINGTIFGHGSGSNKQTATRLAAQAALDAIENSQPNIKG